MRISHRKIILILTLVVLALYGLWQARGYLRGPSIFLESPKEGEAFSSNVLAIKGKALGASRLSLNAHSIFTDEAGNFQEELLLAPGLNTFTLEARDKFGHLVFAKRTVFLK